MRVYADQGANRKILKKLSSEYGFEVVQGHRTEERIDGATQIGEPFTLDVSILDGPDLLVEESIRDVTTIIGRENGADISHIYSAYMDRDCDYFVTANPKDFIRKIKKDQESNGKREELEKIVTGIHIVTIEELITKLEGKL